MSKYNTIIYNAKYLYGTFVYDNWEDAMKLKDILQAGDSYNKYFFDIYDNKPLFDINRCYVTVNVYKVEGKEFKLMEEED